MPSWRHYIVVGFDRLWWLGLSERHTADIQTVPPTMTDCTCMESIKMCQRWNVFWSLHLTLREKTHETLKKGRTYVGRSNKDAVTNNNGCSLWEGMDCKPYRQISEEKQWKGKPECYVEHQHMFIFCQHVPGAITWKPYLTWKTEKEEGVFVHVNETSTRAWWPGLMMHDFGDIFRSLFL